VRPGANPHAGPDLPTLATVPVKVISTMESKRLKNLKKDRILLNFLISKNGIAAVDPKPDVDKGAIA
jgi:hypothetical protein